MIATTSAASSRPASASSSSRALPYERPGERPMPIPADRERSGSELRAPATNSYRSSSLAAARCMAPMKLPGPPPITASRSRRPIISITGFLSMSPLASGRRQLFENQPTISSNLAQHEDRVEWLRAPVLLDGETVVGDHLHDTRCLESETGALASLGEGDIGVQGLELVVRNHHLPGGDGIVDPVQHRDKP